MPIERKKTLNVFKDARAAWGSYDDFPVGQPGTDPMPHLSRNRCAQPFWLVSEADQVIIQMSGRGRIEFREVDARDAVIALAPGDTVYIPACVPSRVYPDDENIQIRLKAEPPVREAVAWYCACGALVHSIEIAADAIAQAAYLAAVIAFNADARARRCSACDREHPLADLGDTAWADVARALDS